MTPTKVAPSVKTDCLRVQAVSVSSAAAGRRYRVIPLLRRWRVPSSSGCPWQGLQRSCRCDSSHFHTAILIDDQRRSCSRHVASSWPMRHRSWPIRRASRRTSASARNGRWREILLQKRIETNKKEELDVVKFSNVRRINKKSALFFTSAQFSSCSHERPDAPMAVAGRRMTATAWRDEKHLKPCTFYSP